MTALLRNTDHLAALLLLLALAPVAGAAPAVSAQDPAAPAAAAPETAQPPAPSSNAAAPPRTGTAQGDFDFYVLALSWSPGFCATPAGARAPEQCAAGTNLGFVVHGLWPQYERGSPQNCGLGARSPTRQQIEATHGLYPDDGLARHEWRIHGTCTGLGPAEYFSAVRQARQAIVIPAAFTAPKAEQSLATADVARAFIEANPKLRLGAMAVTCRSGSLQEVRICFSKDLRQFRNCPSVSRSSCRVRQISVPPVH
jgi:ribonuclease T2